MFSLSDCSVTLDMFNGEISFLNLAKNGELSLLVGVRNFEGLNPDTFVCIWDFMKTEEPSMALGLLLCFRGLDALRSG